MKPNRLNSWATPALLAASFAATATLAIAQSGSWTGTGFGPNNWSASGQWNAGTVANGASNTASFNSNITQGTVLTLDSTRTIGNITFDDSGATGDSPWLFRGNSTLTLDNGASQAVITKSTTTTISTPIAGSNIRINGGAGLNLIGNNTGITGALTLGGINGVNIGTSNAFGSATVSLAAAEVVGGITRDIAIANNFTFNSTYYQGSFGLTFNGTLTLTGGGQGFQTWGAITDTVQAGAVSLGANTLNVGGGAVGGLRISGNITGTGGVAKSGTSTLTLSGANSYTGATTVTAGRLVFNSSANSSDLTVSNTGTILGGEGTSSNAITLGAGSILAADPSTTTSLTTTGALSIPGAVTVALQPTQGMTPGTNVVDVVKYGTFTGTELANLTLPSGIRSGALANDTVNSKITLSMETGTRTWQGSAGLPDWDALTTDSWAEGDKKFGLGDSVVFDDTAAAGGDVYVVGKLTPGSVVFNNSTLNYTLVPVNSTPNANEITGGTSVVKSGTGTVTFTHTNSYTGGTSIDGGILSFSNGALGTYGPITMNGGTLTWGASNTQDISRRLFLVDGKAATFDIGSNNVSFNTSLGGSAATTASVVKNGAGILTLNNNFAPGTYTGGTTVNGGTISLGTGGTGGFTASPAALGTGLVTINTGARVRLWIQNSHTHDIANNFALNGGRLHVEDGTYNVNGTVSVASGGGIFSAIWGGKNLNINGVISGSGPITVEPLSAQIRFLASNTHAGTVALSNGSLLLNNNQVSSTYTLASGSTLVLRTATVAGNITGAGSVTKDISTFGSSIINGDNNTYSGSTTVNIDRFTVGSTGVINGTSGITVQGQWAASFNNLGSVTTPGNISVAGTGNTTNGGVSTESSIFRNSGTVSAASILLNSSASTNTTANRGGTYTQTAGATTASVAVTLAPNGGTGAAGTAGNDAVLNLNGGSLTAPTIALNSGTLNATAGTITLGAGGLSSAGTNTIAVNLGAATLAASAPWSSPVAATLTDSATGTSIDTTAGDITLNGVLSGTGNLNKVGTGTLTITGTNTYSGATYVDSGILAVDGDALADGGDLNIDGGMVAPSGGTEVVNQLFFGGIQQAAGTWGASGSGATNIDNARFTGTGVVSVTTGPATGYGVWASTNAGNQAAGLDFDNDGVSNGVEYFMNATAGFTANPGLNGSNTVTWVNGGNISDSAYGTEFVVQTSSDLSVWNDVPLVNVTNTAGSVSYTLSGSGPKFVRLKVTPN
jgi:fibronectin-binding autotransporter adhesin